MKAPTEAPAAKATPSAGQADQPNGTCTTVTYSDAETPAALAVQCTTNRTLGVYDLATGTGDQITFAAGPGVEGNVRSVTYFPTQDGLIVNAAPQAEHLEFFPIKHEGAKAIQPFAVRKDSPNTQLARRLLEFLKANRSEFEQAGFQWRGNEPALKSKDIKVPEYLQQK